MTLDIKKGLELLSTNRGSPGMQSMVLSRWLWENREALIDTYAKLDAITERERHATREEAMASIFALAGGWGSEDDARIVSYITYLEKRLAAKT